MKNFKRVLLMTIAFALIIAQVAMAAVAIPPDGTYIGTVKASFLGISTGNQAVKVDINADAGSGGKSGTALITYIGDVFPTVQIPRTNVTIPEVVAKGFTYTIVDNEVRLATHIPSKAQSIGDKILAKLGLTYTTPEFVGTKINVLNFTYSKSKKTVTLKDNFGFNIANASGKFTKRENSGSTTVKAKNLKKNRDASFTITVNNAAPTVSATLDGSPITLTRVGFNKYTYSEFFDSKGSHKLAVTSKMNNAFGDILTTGSKTKTFKFRIS